MDGFSYSTFAYYFLSLLLEGAPFILLGTMLSGFIDVYMPAGMLERFLPKKKLPAVMLCGLLGIILPVCECAVVPVIRRLVAKGLPVSCAFTYMLAAPIVNPVTILSTWSAFSEQQALYITLSRIGIGYLLAVVVGLIVMWVPIEKVLRKSLIQRISKKEEHADCSHAHDQAEDACCGSHEHSHDNEKCCAPVHAYHLQEKECCGHDHSHGSQSNYIVSAMRSGMKDFVDVAVYFTIGVSLTAMFNILQVDYYDQVQLYANDLWKGTGLLMILAFVLSVCSTSDAFIAASLSGFNYAAKMAFMVFGPMLDVKLLFLYQTVMRRSFLLYFCLGLFVLVGGTCILWSQWDGLFEWCQSLESKIGGGR